MAQPVVFRPTLCERVTDSHAASQIREYVVVVARLADRWDRLLHREYERVLWRPADVVPFKGRGGGQDDVGVPCQRIPPRLVDHDRLGPLPGIDQAVEILVVMERVAATPVNEADIGVGEGLAVVVERLARVQQHVRDTGDRDEILDGVRPLR